MLPNISQVVGSTILLLCVFAWTGSSSGYHTIFLEDFCLTSETSTFTVGAVNANASGILRSTRNNTFLHHRHCTVTVQPPFGYGVVLTVRYLDMRPFRNTKCENYVLVTGEEENAEFYLCGYSDDVAEYKSYYTTGPMKIVFHTETPNDEAHSDISIIITSFLKRRTECPLHMFQCQNDRCIWEGLTCDDHNNCGDRSDEDSFSRSHWGGYWSIVGIAIGVVIVVSVFVVFPIVLWYRRRSRSRDEELRGLLPGEESVQNQGGDVAGVHHVSGGSGNSSTRPHNRSPPPTYEDSIRQST